LKQKKASTTYFISMFFGTPQIPMEVFAKKTLGFFCCFKTTKKRVFFCLKKAKEREQKRTLASLIDLRSCSYSKVFAQQKNKQFAS
jgi:hypothetical protein